MRVGSLFTGIGGFDLGFERAGMEVAWQCEIDTHARRVLAGHWPGVPCYEDVRGIRAGDVPAVDLICGGFPCQDVSVAGRRAGLDGERSGLWFEFARVLGELRPQWVVIENVPGLLSGCGCALCRAMGRIARVHTALREKRARRDGTGGEPCAKCDAAGRLHRAHSGRNFLVILSALVKLGYGVSWWSPDAQYFGLAQRRERVFIVGHLGDGRAIEVLPELAGLCGHPPPGRAAREGSTYEIAPSLTSSGRGVERPGESRGQDPIVLTRRGRDGGSADEIEQYGLSPALRTAGGGSGRAPTVVAATIRSEYGEQAFRGDGADNLVVGGGSYPTVNEGIAPSVTARHADQTAVFAVDLQQVTNPTNRSTEQPLAPTLSQGQRLVTYAIQDARAMEKSQNGLGVTESGPAYTLDRTGAQGVYVPDVVPNAMSSKWAKGAGGPAGDEIQNLVALGLPRRLTPTECERLQGFPDGWTAGADSHRYRQLGNAVAVPVAEWIGRRIMAAAR